MGVNPNTMTFKTVFHAEYQMSHHREPVYQVFADSRLEASLTKGQTIGRSYTSDIVVNDMGADGSYETQPITDTQETLNINKEKEASIYIKELDVLQAHLPLKKKYGRKLGNALVSQIDGDVLLAVYQGAGTTLDDGDFAGTSGNGFTVTSTNVATVFTAAMQKLRLKNVVYSKRFKSSAGMKLEVPEGMPSAAISPEILTYIELYLGGKNTLLGDKVSRNGYSGYFMGFELFVTNSLPWTGQLAIATAPTDGDTIVINSVTFTFKTTLGTTAGNVLIGASAATAVTNLVALINTPGTTTSEGVALSTANKKLLKNIVATDNTTTIDIVSSGRGTIVVSETLQDVTDAWTTGKQILHNIFAIAKSISLVIQKNPTMTINPVSGKVGKDFVVWTVYGSKVFIDQAPQIVSLGVNSASFTAAAQIVN